MSSSHTIGGSIVLEGAKQYNSDLKDIQSNMKELRSEMKLSNSEYADNENSADALSSKYEILSKEYDEIGKRVQTYEKMLSEAKTTQETAGHSIDNYKTQLSDAKAKLEDMKASGTATDEELKNQQQIVSDLSGKLMEAQGSYDTASSKITQYQTSLNNAKAEQTNLGNEMTKTSEYLDEAKNSADGCAKSIDQYGKSTKGAEDSTDKFGKSIDDAVNTMSTMLAASGIQATCDQIKDALLECDEAADKFETSMAKINTIAGLSGTGLSSMSSQIKTASADMGVASTDLAEATYQAMSAGIDVNKAVDFASQATQLSIGGFTDATTAVDTLTTVLNAYGMTAEDTQHVEDDLVTTQNLGKTTVNELGASLGKVIPTAAAYGVSIDQVCAAYSELTNKGIKTKTTTTYLNSMFNELGDAGSKVGKTLKDETGQSFGELMKSGKTLGDVLTILYGTVDNNSEAFMNMWSSSEAAKGAIDIASDSGAKYSKMLAAMGDNAGATSAAFETMEDTGEQLDAKLSTSFENLKIAVGDALGPSLDTVHEGMIGLIEPLTDFCEENPKVVTAIGGIVAGMTALAAGVGIAAAAIAAFTAITAVANPALVATSLAISAVSGGILALSLDIDPAITSFKNLTETSEKFNDTESKNIDQRNQSSESLEAQRSTVDGLVDELENLQSQTSLSADEQSRQKDVVDELNSAMPDLNLAIDDQTGKLNMSSEALEQNTDKLMDNLEAAAAEQEITDIAKERLEAETQLKDLEEQLSEVQDNRTMSLEAQNIAEKNLSDQITETKDNISQLDDQTETSRQCLEDHAASADDDAASQIQLGDAVGETKDLVKEYGEDTVKAYQDTYNAALSSIQGTTGLFESLKDSAQTNLGAMDETLKGNNEKFSEYGQNLSTAVAFARDNPDYQGVVDAITQMGMSGSGEMQAFVDGIDSDTGKATESLQKLKDEYADYSEITDNIATLTSDIESGFSVGYHDINFAIEQGTSESTETMQTANETQETNATEHHDKMVTTETGTIDDMATAVTTETPKVTAATTQMCDTTLSTVRTKFGIDEKMTKSTVFSTIGKTIDSSIASGIKEGQGSVASALQECLQNAINSLSFSSISSKVNKALGEAMR